MKKLFAFLMFSIVTLSYVEGGGKTQGSGNVDVAAPVVQSNTASQTMEPQKFALVIGNGNYTGLTKLANPVNDANDVAAALQDLGFTVDKILDGSLDQIENAVMRLKNRLSVSRNSYGFFFYAGHGVQSNGVNYLIPVGANITSENTLRDRAVSVQWTLSELNDAGNELNVVVLDACRDNPFGWARAGSRGLAVLSGQPADSIIVYATSAGSTAADGTGRNGLFTAQLLKNIATPGMEVKELFNRTGADVAQASNRQQIPAVYNQFFGSAYLGSAPVVPAPSPQSSVAVGTITVTSEIAGEILIDGEGTGISVKDGGTATITNVSTGNTEVAVKEPNGAIIKAPQMVMVRQGQTVTAFIEQPAPDPPPSLASVVQPAAMPQPGLTPQPSPMPLPGPTPQPSPMPLPSDQKQTTAGSVGYSFMNVALGLGSYLQGDTKGGLAATGGYAAALGLIAWELNLHRGDAMAGIVGPIGIGVGAATLIYGFLKPRIYTNNIQFASAPLSYDQKRTFGGDVGYGFMNIAFGLGSYLQGDTKGGLFLTGGYAAALGLFAWGINLDKSSNGYDNDFSGVSGVSIQFGALIGAATLISGFIRPLIYNIDRRFAYAPLSYDQKPMFGRDIGHGFLNFVFGLGSYRLGDKAGGLISTTGHAAALGLIVWGIVSPDSNFQLPCGIGVLLATEIFDFVRPLIYNNNRLLASAISNFDIALVPGGQNKNTLAVRYTHSF